MNVPKLPFNFRISELLPVARLLRASYVRDRADFVDLLPEDYTPKFLTNFDNAIEAVEKVVRSSVSVAQRQVVTQRIEGLVEALPRLLNRLEARVRRADNLTVPAQKFGIEAVRHDRNNDEHEGLAESLRTLLQNIEANQKALAAKGLTTDEISQLQTLYDNLVADRTTQGSALSDQRLLTADNVQLFRTLYGFLQDLLDDGKSLYKDGADPKLKDYTLRKVLQQVRREQKAGEEGA
jgi:vacuolar-type H+-ATPase subunit I/STV1